MPPDPWDLPEGQTHSALDAQPVSTVEWVPAERLRANSFNPNKVFAPELRLLKLSILEDGWTQPLLRRVLGVRQAHDGHESAGQRTDLRVLPGRPRRRRARGRFPPLDALQRLATVRHNRARGQHHVLKMADIVNDLTEAGYAVPVHAGCAGLEPSAREATLPAPRDRQHVAVREAPWRVQ